MSPAEHIRIAERELAKIEKSGNMNSIEVDSRTALALAHATVAQAQLAAMGDL